MADYICCADCNSPQLRCHEYAVQINQHQFRYNMFACVECQATLCPPCQRAREQGVHDSQVLHTIARKCLGCGNDYRLVYYNDHHQGFSADPTPEERQQIEVINYARMMAANNVVHIGENQGVHPAMAA